MSDPIKANASARYRAVHQSGKRTHSPIWIVVHSTEGSTARGAATWFQNPDSSGSAHMVVDDNEAYRTLYDDEIPWSAPGANTLGWHIEFAGFARWTREQWLVHDKELRRGAFKIALRCQRFNITPRWIGPWGLRRKKPGLTCHIDCTKALGGNHTNPGPGFPKDVLLAYVKEYLNGMEHD